MKRQTEKVYNKDGVLVVEYENIDGRREGMYKEYYAENGQLAGIKFYHNGMIHGEFITYDETGIVSTKGFFWENDIVGEYFMNYSTGEEQHHLFLYNVNAPRNFPFLPKKPRRLFKKERFQMLEIK